MNEQRNEWRGIIVVGGVGALVITHGKIKFVSSFTSNWRRRMDGMVGGEEVSKLQFTIYGDKHVDRVIWQTDICV